MKEVSGFEYKQVIIIREDLGMSTGKLVSQACHACLEASAQAKEIDHKAWEAWRREGGKKVIVAVDSKEELIELEKKAEELGLPCTLITDRGLTELPPGTHTALGIGPAESTSVDRLTGSLRLLA